ncbi:transmembrane protein, putative [Rhizoctonia solani AG-3 Rhs1AP]|uniref:Transmembrane protein, putative n=1 Tax=Rhizoctonia solani AG-3 Rhs1AP TaxID=1086054 RepID=X8JE23_9AGAM|nr:transmembrane protein, putative [Rhizoctonia solani AG-3 Rhs1AP]
MHTPGNAPATEQTPLLSSSNTTDTTPAQDCRPKVQQHTRVPWTYHVGTLAFVILSFVLCLIVTIIFTVHAYVSPLLRTEPSVLAQRSLVYEGPSRFNVLNYTSDGIWCEVTGAATIDASRTLGLSSNRFTDKLVGWAARRVGSVTISTSRVQVFSYDNTYLAALELPTITLPLSTKYPPHLQPITVQVLLRPAKNVDDIVKFASHSWETGVGELRVHVDKGLIVGGNRSSGWRKWIHVEKHDIGVILRLEIPPIPGIPPAPPNGPRPTPDLASLVYLQSYRVLPPPPTLRLVGTATLPNPLPSILQGAIALSLPFVVSLPPIDSKNPLPIARVETAPLGLTTPNISLAISGHVLPLPSSSSSIAPVSRFASDFLAARPSPVLITTDFLRDLGILGELTVKAEFPASAERPDLLRDVQISNMRIVLRGEQIFASAFVRAHIVPPTSLLDIHINATRVWPDLLVYDGPAPQLWPFNNPNSRAYSGVEYDEQWTEPDPMPLPRPLPRNAFARIRPDSWIIAHTQVSDDQHDDNEGQGVWVHAQVSDVPLDVLPGRDGELRAFIRKVLFNPGGAQAGVAGISAVAARVGGLVVGSKESGELEMYGLPLRGETWVGKKSMLGWDLPSPEDSIPLPTIPAIPTRIPTALPHIPVPTFISEPPRRPTSVPVPQPKVEPEPEVELEAEPYEDLNDEYDYEYWPEPASETEPVPEPKHKPKPPVEDWSTFDGGRDDSDGRAIYQVQSSEELWQIGVAY